MLVHKNKIQFYLSRIVLFYPDFYDVSHFYTFKREREKERKRKRERERERERDRERGEDRERSSDLSRRYFTTEQAWEGISYILYQRREQDTAGERGG